MWALLTAAVGPASCPTNPATHPGVRGAGRTQGRGAGLRDEDRRPSRPHKGPRQLTRPWGAEAESRPGPRTKQMQPLHGEQPRVHRKETQAPRSPTRSPHHPRCPAPTLDCQAQRFWSLPGSPLPPYDVDTGTPIVHRSPGLSSDSSPFIQRLAVSFTQQASPRSRVQD